MNPFDSLIPRLWKIISESFSEFSRPLHSAGTSGRRLQKIKLMTIAFGFLYLKWIQTYKEGKPDMVNHIIFCHVSVDKKY